MAQISNASNMIAPIGRVGDYSTSPVKSSSAYAIMTKSFNPPSYFPQSSNKSDFGDAIYGNGPYSLEHPNMSTEVLAQNVDCLA